MKKTMIVAVVVLVAVFALPALAQAGGWVTTYYPGAPDTPHRNYAQTSRKCQVCHAVHEAETTPTAGNGEKLLRTTVGGSCDYCHVGGPFSSTLQVYGSTSTWYSTDTSRAHNIGAAFTRVPDSADPAGTVTGNDYMITGGLKCTSCHSVHSANTILAGADILKANPMPSNPGTATTINGFCADCHSNNWVTAKDLVGGPDQVSHYMGAVTSATLASTASTNCRSCHSGAAAPTAANNYPHYTTGKLFLKDAYSVVETAGSTKLDGVCLDCHPNVSVQF